MILKNVFLIFKKATTFAEKFTESLNMCADFIKTSPVAIRGDPSFRIKNVTNQMDKTLKSQVNYWFYAKSNELMFSAKLLILSKILRR